MKFFFSNSIFKTILFLTGFGFLLFLYSCNTRSVTKTQKTVTVYSARHYDTDRDIYKDFEKKTGIKVNLIEAKGDLLLEKIKTEGKTSPADVIITVDAGRLWRAEKEGLLQPFHSLIIEENIPGNLRHPENLWFALTKRARVIVYNKKIEHPATSYEALADPVWKKRICIRSSDNIYNQSLLASRIAKGGIEKAEKWAKAVHENLAREPRGGDTDQIRAVAAGECDLAVVNHYYYARLLNSNKPRNQKVAANALLLWPDQGGEGTHVNISGAGLAKNAPHPEEARKFLEYLTSKEVQKILSEGNYEFPARKDIKNTSPVLQKLGPFKEDTLNVSTYGAHQREAQKVFDRVNWP